MLAAQWPKSFVGGGQYVVTSGNAHSSVNKFLMQVAAQQLQHARSMCWAQARCQLHCQQQQWGVQQQQQQRGAVAGRPGAARTQINGLS
jgi:hypothetical protein